MTNTSGILLDDNFFHQLLISRNYKLFRHGTCLLMIALVAYTGRSNEQPYEVYIKLLVFTLMVSLFYINMYWLVPKFLLQNKFLSYGLLISVHILISYISISALEQYLKPYMDPSGEALRNKPGLLLFIVLQLILAAASAAIKLVQRWIADTGRIYELEKITMQSELEQLRNQITPHFLFNMLNNANVLTRKDPQKASEVLMRLSDILRYQLYDSARQHVLLTSEIHFLNDFLNLEKVRRDNFSFLISQEGNLSGIQIPPMLFITFVENAVKHNGDPQRESFVHVYFYVDNNSLTFKCINSKPPEGTAKQAVGGIGLINIRRRLELLYPNRHSLVIREENEQKLYSVTLKIDL